MAVEKIKATDVLRETISILLRERELFLLLGALIAAVSLIFTWPTMEVNARYLEIYLTTGEFSIDLMNQMNQEVEEAGYNSYIPYLMMVFHLVVMALWSRASILGRRHALDGGFHDLLKRNLWVLWRFICGIGWMFLLFVPLSLLFVATFSIPSVASLFSGGFDNGEISFSLILFLIVIYSAFTLVFLVLIFLTSISIHGEARDLRLPIHKSYGYMKGNLFRAASFLIPLLLGSYFLVFIGEFLIIKSYLTTPMLVNLIGMFALTFFSMLATLTSYTFGAIYASKLVPELRV